MYIRTSLLPLLKVNVWGEDADTGGKWGGRYDGARAATWPSG
jgi:hypothetical protein